MNLQDQIGALETSVDQLTELIHATFAQQAGKEPSAQAESTAMALGDDTTPAAAASTGPSPVATVTLAANEPVAEPASAAEPGDETPALQVARPSQNEIVLTVGGKSVSLHPEQVGQLIEELANARASMVPEPPPAMAPGWRFVATKNPAMAVQKQANGDRLLVLRHTGHGWVPYTFSPDMAIQLYLLLTQG
jgi:hypothetical protein